MADKWAVASGNWSSTSTWNDGTLPGPDDDVYADGWSVTINQNVTVLSLNTTQRSGGTAGGSFTVSANGIVVNCSTITGGTTACLWYSGVSPNVATVNCTTINGSSTTSSAHGIFNSSGNGTLNINCTTINGGSGTSSSTNGVRATTATFNIVCSLAVGGNANFGSAIALLGSGTINVTGTVRGGSNATSRGVSNSSTGSIVVNGDVEGGSASIGGENFSTGALTINGLAVASNTAEAVINTSTGILTIARFRFASNGKSPWTGNGKIFFSPLSTVNGDVVNSSGTSRTLGRVGG